MSGWKDDYAVTITYRTLRQAQAEAAIAEQERIIRLLEEIIYSLDEELRISSDFDTFQDLIALIKGEN